MVVTCKSACGSFFGTPFLFFPKPDRAASYRRGIYDLNTPLCHDDILLFNWRFISSKGFTHSLCSTNWLQKRSKVVASGYLTVSSDGEICETTSLYINIEPIEHLITDTISPAINFYKASRVGSSGSLS